MQSIIEQAKKVLKIEAHGILDLIERIDASFEAMVDIILQSKGRLIVSGIGKSGIVGRKIVATLNSTGTRSLFLHPVEAMHGDLGIVGADDVFLALSNSGETDELNLLVPSIRNIGCKIIAFTGGNPSTLAEHSDIVIHTGVTEEACPLGLAPTTSTTAMLAMGDALAVVLINKRHFKPSDFKKFHPGGMLGHRLSSRVDDLMLTGDTLPIIHRGTPMEKAIEEIDHSGLGATLVLDDDSKLCGIITDGDIRRAVTQKKPIFDLTADDIMTASPKRMRTQALVYDALNMMEQHQITVLPITDPHETPVGILHLHDILGKGEFKFNGK